MKNSQHIFLSIKVMSGSGQSVSPLIKRSVLWREQCLDADARFLFIDAFLFLVCCQSKRISAKDALAHPYLDEGRLRYHTCMCKCCYTTSSGRVYTSDFEPVTNPKFDDGFEKNLSSVRQVKGQSSSIDQRFIYFLRERFKVCGELQLSLMSHPERDGLVKGSGILSYSNSSLSWLSMRP